MRYDLMLQYNEDKVEGLGDDLSLEELMQLIASHSFSLGEGWALLVCKHYD